MPTKADAIKKLQAGIAAEKDPKVKAAMAEKLTKMQGKPAAEGESEYLDAGMSKAEYDEAKVAKGGSQFPVEGAWPLLLGKPYADTVSRADGSESWEVFKFPWESREDAPFQSTGEFTAFKGVNPNTGKSSLKTTLEAAGAKVIEKDGKVLFKPSDVMGKVVRGYFKIPVNPETGEKNYYDQATDSYLPSRIAKLVTFLPLEDKKGTAATAPEKELPF